MFKKYIINIVSFITGAIVMFGLVKLFDNFLWFRPSLYPTSMRLVANGGLFKIYSSPGTGLQDFAVFRGNECLVSSKVISSSSNIYEITHFENGFSVLQSRIRDNRTEKRDYIWCDVLGHVGYFYYDTNADGIWDMFFNVKDKKKYIWYNDRWEPMSNKKSENVATNDSMIK